MGNQLCPAETKNFIQGFRELEKGEKQHQYYSVLKCCVSQQTLEESQFLQIYDIKNDKVYQNDQQNEENLKVYSKSLIEHSINLKPQQQKSNKVFEHQSQQTQNKQILDLLLPNGWKYRGQTLGSIPEGKGEQIGPNGDYYCGNFHRGRKDGYGIYKFGSGSIYKGEFKDNVMWGHGIFQFLNGDSFQGEFIENKRQGRGKYILHQPNIDDLLYFEGEYKNDKKNGPGVMKYIDHQMKGNWKDGNYHYSFSSQQNQSN